MLVKYRHLPFMLFIFFMIEENAIAFDIIDRRRDQFAKDFSYYVYPFATTIPGLGKAVGGGGSVLNMFETDTDFVGIAVRGDFDATILTLLDLHLIEKRLIFDIGYTDYAVGPTLYKRGMNSNKDDYIRPTVEGDSWIGQLTLSFMQRQIESYVRYSMGKSRTLKVLDKDDNEFGVVDTSKYDVGATTIGASLDFTDDKLDPRKGLRFELAGQKFRNDEVLNSDFFVMDYNLTGYIPFRRWDTLVLNLFSSKAHITRQATTDYDTLQQQFGLGCDQIPAGPDREQCLATEREFIDQRIAQNKYGTATPLGGTQRLRSFDGSRFYAGSSLFYGIEYRWNLTDEHTPFNIYIARGIRTGIQVAFFVEQGSVAEHYSDLLETRRTSYGTGFRLVLSGAVLRFDLAWGDESYKPVFFINYSWSMFSLDQPY